MGTLKSIQALRAVAATLVLLCHLFAIDQQTAQRDAPILSFWENGAYGVDLFFVISGFVIVWVSAQRRRGWQSAAAFLSARAVRIYPTWWLFAGLMAIALWLTRGVPWDATRVEYWGMSGVDHLRRSFLLLPQAHHPVLGVGWSLVHEIYFYIVFAVFIWVIPIKQRALALWIWTGLVLFGGLWGFAEEFAQTWTALVFYPMTLEFCAGGLIAYLIQSRVTRFAYASFAIGSLGFLTVFLGGDHYLLARLEVDLDIAHVWQRTLTYGVCAVLIVYGTAASEVRAKRALPIPRSLVRLGDWSYALYLCHPLVISVIGRTCYRGLGLEGPVAALGVLTLSLVASLALAGLVYTMFERPLIVHFKRWQSGRRALITAPAAE